RRAARAASSRERPRRMWASVAISRWKPSSSSSSARSRLPRSRPRAPRPTARSQAAAFPIVLLIVPPSRQAKDGLHRSGEDLPLRRLSLQIRTTQVGQSVELRPAVVLGYAPLRLEDTLVPKPVERRIE